MPSGRPRPDWTRVAFGDIALCVNDRADQPAAAGVQRYVGLEHLHPDSLTIRRWGTPSDVKATKLRFRKGDIIFGRRRVYQRKLAVADFDGICSAHALVLRAKPGAVLPQFLPFFMQSDAFMERAKAISVGSLSPTINWRTLAAEEFALPPLDEQRRIARAAVALQTARDRHRISADALSSARDAVVHSTIPTLSAYPLARLADCSDVRYGLTVNPDRRVAGTEKVPYLRVANVLRGTVDLTEVKMTNGLDGDERYRLLNGDVLIVEGHANLLEIGRASVWADELPDVLHQNHVIRVRCDESALPDYVCMLINSPHGRRYFRSRARSSSGLNTINSTVVKDYSLPLPPPPVQQSVLNRLRSLDAAAGHLSARLKTLDGVSRLVLRSLDR